jgi:isopropylmalate/homocitrate/citramalate synthase
MAGLQVRSNQGIVGDDIFKVESGIISTWVKNSGDEHALELCPYRWDLVGHDAPEIVLGKSNGTDSIKMWLERIGRPVPDEDTIMAILVEVKAKSMEKRGLLTLREFENILAKYPQSLSTEFAVK